MTVSNSGIYYIDSLLLNQSWSGTTRTSSTVNYAFGKDASSASDRSLQFEQNQINVDGTLQYAVQTALAKWASYANISFQHILHPSAGDQPLMISLTRHDLPSGYAGITYLYEHTPQIQNVDVIVSPSYGGAELGIGGYGFFTTLHELGHAIGLDHPFEGNNRLPTAEDNWNYTLMSYTEGGYANLSNLPISPMLYDVAAVQYLYGANQNTNSGNNQHIINTGQGPSVLWDGGGIDTIDSSGYHGAVTIDLQEGISDVNQIGSTFLWIAFGANIEGALTGDGNDTVSGNGLFNTLTAGSGNDFIFGHDGDDTLQGNRGTDNINGGQGNDVILGGKDNDTLHGGKDNDHVNSNIGDDYVYGNLGDDTLHGGQNNDLLEGGSGNDMLNGDRDNDTLIGGDGNDIFVFDTLQNATDVITDFSASQDQLMFSFDLFPNATDVLAASSFDGSTATITLHTGGMILLHNLSTMFTADDLMIG